MYCSMFPMQIRWILAVNPTTTFCASNIPNSTLKMQAISPCTRWQTVHSDGTRSFFMAKRAAFRCFARTQSRVFIITYSPKTITRGMISRSLLSLFITIPEYVCMLRVYLECDGQYGCLHLELYCPETAECALNCSSSGYVCDGELFISDPGGQHDDSLLDIHCEDDDCLLITWWCPEIENTTTNCDRSMYLPVTPLDLNCTADSGVCEV